jgi:pilus assembly protein CpaB
MGSKVLFTLPALTLALLALVLALVGLSRDPAPAEQEPAAREQASATASTDSEAYRYWMVSEPVEVGATLNEQNLAVLTADTPIANAIGADQPLAGTPVQRFIAAGELVGADTLAGGGSLASVLPAGFRALAISVNEVSTVGELLRPGDLVDVIGSFKRSDEGKPAALVLLKRVPVLAVHGSLSASDGQEESRRRNNTVVLSVPEARVPALMLASSEASLRLAVVGGADRNATPETVASAAGNDDAAPAGAGESVASTGIKPFYFDDFFPEHKKPAAARPAPRRSPGQRVQIFEGSESRSTYVR